MVAIGSTAEAHEERLYVTILAIARAVLDTAAFAAAWSTGEAMPLEVALAKVLQLGAS